MCDRCGETPCLRHCPCTLFYTCLHHRPDYNCGYVGMEQVETMEREGWESEEAMRAFLAQEGAYRRWLAFVMWPYKPPGPVPENTQCRGRR